MEIKKYNLIDKELLDTEYANKLMISKSPLDGFNFHSVIWNYKKDWDRSHQTNTGYGLTIREALEESNLKERDGFKNLRGDLNKNVELNSLENLILHSNLKIVSKKTKGGVRTYLSKDSFWKTKKDQVLGIVAPTFSEGIYLLSQMFFDSNEFRKISYCDSLSKALNENRKSLR